jgi:predicted RNA-binding Zn-ribbon protein involved in translation (DUF1610 family)
MAPRFFCEDCGAEVKRDSKTCPRCGKFFASIKCPACGFVGEEILFKSGCPACGYSAAGGKKGRGKKDVRYPSGALPLWVYLVTVLGLAAVLLSLLLWV